MILGAGPRLQGGGAKLFSKIPTMAQTSASKPVNAHLWLVLIWLASRVWIWLSGTYADRWIEAAPRFLPPGDGWAQMFNRFDGLRYLEIADRGYFMAIQGPAGWFPGYPLLIQAFGFLENDLVGGVVVSNLAFLGALVCLYHLLKLDFTEGAVRRIILLVVAFPTAFLSSCVYAEPTFLLCSVSSLLALRTDRWKLSVLLAAAAALVRPQGCVLAVVLLWEYSKREERSWLDISMLALIPAAVLAFFAHLKLKLGFFSAYFIVQRELGYSLGVAGTLAAGRPLVAEHKVALGFLALELLLLIVGWKSMKPLYRVYLVLAMTMPLVHTQGLCTHRFMWVLFPLFIALEERVPRKLYPLVLLASWLAQAWLFGLWVQGYRTTY